MKNYARLFIWAFLALGSRHVGAEDPETLSLPVKDEPEPTRFGYLLVIPKILEAESEPRACVSLHNVDEGVNVNVTVRLHNSKDTLNYWSAMATMGPDVADKCFLVAVPEVTGKKMKLAAISVKIVDLGDELEGFTRQANSTKKLLIRPAGFTIYINTDKQIYKPGQDVLFRILQLHGLYPTGHEITKVTIVDPKDRKLQVYRNLTPSRGLVSENFQLVAEPTLGRWNIKVECEGKTFQTSFKVEEYVLPKYEVTIEVPKYLHVESGKFPVKVCGKYTYGKPVRGEVLLKLEIITRWYYRSSSRPAQLNRTKTDETGCAVVEGDPNIMQFKSRDYPFHQMLLQVTADITEEFTGIKLSGKNKECQLTNTPYIVSIEEHKSYFRPGLRWAATAHYADDGKEPLPDRRLTFKIRAQLQNGTMIETRRNITTDGNGDVVLAIDTDYTVFQYHLEVFDPSIPAWDYNWWNTNEDLRIRGSPAYARIMRAFSPSFSFATIDEFEKGNLPLQCLHATRFTGSAVVTYDLLDGAETPEVFYMVTSRKSLIEEGKADVSALTNCEKKDYVVNSNRTKTYNTCELTFEATTVVTSNWVPEAKIMVYFVKEDGEVVADDISLPVGDCFENKASLDFDSASVRPGDHVALTLSAEPRSLCALSIVDKSVHLLGGDNSFTSTKVSTNLKEVSEERVDYVEAEGCGYSDFQYRYIVDDNDGVTDRWAYGRKRRSVNQIKKRQKRRSLFRYGGERDAFSSFEHLQLMFLTNLRIHLLNCDRFYYHPIAYGQAMDINEGAPVADSLARVVADSAPEENVIELRNYFPETWKWELVEIGDYGTATLVNQEMPDTITEWVATSYCISEEAGVGVSDIATVKGFKPVFLSMTLPYSVIRGEEITIKASVFNYLSPDTCLEMVISLEKTGEFEILGESKSTSYKCICGSEAAGLSFDIRPLALGKITFTIRTWSRDGHLCGKEVTAHGAATDGVERTLTVEAEGVEEETTANDFLCVENDSPVTTTQIIEVPEDAYEGSARVLVNVIGSIMGPVMNNLNHLIRVPYGCGEQNMVTMVPNMVVLKYLAATGKLTPELQKTIENNILLGYQRQLNYQRQDGSFSAFGDSDTSGSTWLTAFVISTFENAKEYIFIDDDVIEKARRFLVENTEEDGCVKKVGLVHNKRMMGGAEGKNALNAYVSLALHRPGDPVEPISPADVTGCDGSAALKLYTLAIKFYTNALKGKHDAAKLLWSSLKSKATVPNGVSFDDAQTVFWSDMAPEEEEDEDTPSWWYYQKPSDAVEVTGYVLMGYVRMEEAFQEDFPIEKAYAIVQWLTSQRNAYGGWSSTQNTIIGLSALAAYASRTYVEETQVLVALLSDGVPGHNFSVSADNSLTVQQSVISTVPTAVTYEASGRGCVLVQTNLRYNVPRKEPDPAFTISTFVHGLEKGCDAPGKRHLVVCATYQGTHDQPVSNMAVFEIKLVSGYRAVKESLTKMAEKNKFNGLKRYELDGKKVTIYFRAIGSENKCAAFEVSYDEEVKNPQPGTARVYDYYDPVKEATTLYNLSCRWETYNPETYTHDCMQWSKHGLCDKACLVSRAADGFCATEIASEPRRFFDYCKMWGDRSCGDNGVCINTNTYFRCSCNEGFKESRWGRRCIPEEEEEPDIMFVLEEGVFRTTPDCEDVCPQPASVLRGGNDTTYFCDDGYTLVGNDSKAYCEDVDECSDDPCDSDTLDCRNNPGSYACSCTDGYVPYIDADENIIELSRCIAVEGEAGEIIGVDGEYEKEEGDKDEDEEEEEEEEGEEEDEDDEDGNEDEGEGEDEEDEDEGEDEDEEDEDEGEDEDEEDEDEDDEEEEDEDDEDEDGGEDESKGKDDGGEEEEDEEEEAEKSKNEDVDDEDEGEDVAGEEEGGHGAETAILVSVSIPPPFRDELIVETPVLTRPEIGEMKAACPVCRPSFPKPSEYKTVFCPKVNVYVVTNSSSVITLRAIVFHGEPIYGTRIKDVELRIDSTCVCDNLLAGKAMIITPHDAVQSPSGNSITIDQTTTITIKRAWKKVQTLTCSSEGDLKIPDMGETLEETPDVAPETTPEVAFVPELISVPKTVPEEPK